MAPSRRLSLCLCDTPAQVHHTPARLSEGICHWGRIPNGHGPRKKKTNFQQCSSCENCHCSIHLNILTFCMMSARAELTADRTCFTGSTSKVAGAAFVVGSACFSTTSLLPPQTSPLISHSHAPITAPGNQRRRQILPKPPSQKDLSSSSEQLVTTSFLPPQTSPLDSCSHRTSNAAPANPRRRQILPKPPSQKDLSSSSSSQPSQRVAEHRVRGSSIPQQRKWHSTSSLLKAPKKSCLRPSRYSSSSIATSADSDLLRRNANAYIPSSTVSRREGMIKNVSFYSQVYIFEFQPPLEQASEEGWLSYFF